MRKSMLFAVIPVLFLIANVHGTIINVPGDSTTIQSAIGGAVSGDTVLVAEGHYYERLDFLGKDILVTSNYLNTGDPLTIENTIIDGDTSVIAPGQSLADTACVVIFCNGETADAILQGFTIQNGLGWNASNNFRYGGGISCLNVSSPTITHNIIRQNYCSHNGGAICCQTNCSATITHNTITDNSAGNGGGVLLMLCSSLISDNTISNNTAGVGLSSVQVQGGGIYGYRTSSTIIDNIISENTAKVGGGIFLYGYTGICSDSIAGNEITLNNAIGTATGNGLGGGIAGMGSHSIYGFTGQIIDNTITDNSASMAGGGIYMKYAPSPGPAIYGNTITGNTANGSDVNLGGAGMCLDQINYGSISFNLLAQNVSTYAGGGIALWNCTMPLSDNTIADNTGLVGGAVYGYYSTTTLTNTICWNDSSTYGSTYNELWSVSGSMTATYCDVEGGFTGTGNLNCDPAFCHPDTGNYYLEDVSCCVGTGQGGTDIGAYGIGCSAVIGPPMPVDDLVIERIGTTTARLSWSQVTEDTTGSPLAVDYYRIHRNLDPNFVPSPADSIGYTTSPDTSYDDVNALWNYDKYFYQVIAVDTDGVDVSQSGGDESGRVTTISVPSPADRQAIRSRRSQR